MHARGQEFDSPMLHYFHRVVIMVGSGIDCCGYTPKAIVYRNLHINQLPIGTIIWVNVNEHATGAQTMGFPWNCLKSTKLGKL